MRPRSFTDRAIPLWNWLPEHVDIKNFDGFKEACLDVLFANGTPKFGTVSFTCSHKTYLLDPMLHLILCLSESKEQAHRWKLRIPTENAQVWTPECLEAKFSFCVR